MLRPLILIAALIVSPLNLQADDAGWIAEPTAWPLPTVDASQVVTAFSLSADDSQLAVGISTGEVLLLNSADGTLIRRWRAHAEKIYAIQFLPAGEQVATAGDDGSVRLWQTSEGMLLDTLTGHTRWVTSLAVTRQGQLASGSYDRAVRIWDLQSKPIACQVYSQHEAAVKAVGFSSDGSRLVSGSADRTAIVWNLKTKQALKTFKGHHGAIR
ncbi:MAG TPA: hypothetical protein VM165_12445, partial [Planctomycetaceae bacterium]|nr:hypothetical protein [Planctomycetaceae bacterium]